MIKSWLNRLHARMGDLWWYSLMIFIACRSGDLIQAFIGLWLVPKYVGSNELGAVLPLQQLSGLFAVPLAAIATVFSKFVNTYATRGETGKVKCFIRDVLAVSIIVFSVCIVVAVLVVPHFYVRLKVASGMLTVLILAAGFLGNLSTLFTSALQGLKKFTTITVQSVICAPIRLLTLVVSMPFRALSGYILGQATPSATCSALAAFSLHRDLKAIPVDRTWRMDLPAILRYFWPIAIYTAATTLFGTIQSTVYRQRLPEIESAAYYMLSRFSEIAGYVGSTMGLVLFPMASEAHESGRERRDLLSRTIWSIVCGTLLLGVAFALTADALFSQIAIWREYREYAYLLPAMTAIGGMSAIAVTYVTYEMACKRFAIPIVVILFSLIWTVFLVTFTGWRYFEGWLPAQVLNMIGNLHIDRLHNLVTANIVLSLVQTAIVVVMFRFGGNGKKT